jgi:hypothetical protein
VQHSRLICSCSGKQKTGRRHVCWRASRNGEHGGCVTTSFCISRRALIVQSFMGDNLMSYLKRLLRVALVLLACISSGVAYAADLPVKAVAPVAAPFFFVSDNRLTYAYQFTGTDPGFANQTAKQVLAFTHFDAWAYGTNFINLELIKSDHADPASPCPIFQPTGCAGATRSADADGRSQLDSHSKSKASISRARI